MNMIPVELDLQGMRDCLLRRGTPRRVFFFEHAEAEPIKDAIVKRYGLMDGEGETDPNRRAWAREIRVQRFLGHELFRVRPPNWRITDKMAHEGDSWENEHGGPIQTWADFESFPWVDPAEVDFSQLEWYEKNLPLDMGVYVTTHIWEHVRVLMGFEAFCYKLYEEPELVDAVAAKVGEFNLALARALCGFRSVFAVYGSDDLGFKTATIIQPDVLREKILPWHRRMAAEAHDRGKLYLLHCCGDVTEIMDDLIDDVGIDAKHSFEDVIEPVTEAKARWGARVALLGGLDVDLIVRADEETIRSRVRDTLDVCQPGGGYCLGLGNWVTDYIPLENYLVVLDEGRRYGRG